ncbi:Hypothetical predicted protein [Lecanosticta acicola]|uniref:SUN domain-containing protein n=1 Tax=Lecanosticta acicola TaxID=111012 RepID=A0AAI8Z5D3_9PEZI|nr:Hypothetical predicted protein [Lecanosticta acicola]
MNRLLRLGVLIWGVYGATGNTSSAGPETTAATPSTTTTTHATPRTSSTTFYDTAGLSSKLGNATCPSRTVNYITHTLPRQCLRTDRVPHNATHIAASNSTETVSTNVGTYQDAGSTTPTAHIDPSTPGPSNETSSVDIETVDTGVSTTTTTSTVTSSTEVTSTAKTALEPSVAVAEEADSPLDNANFLSFEEWKKQNLAKTGQSPDDVGHGQLVDPHRPRPGINNALDTLGEESEINLDFSGFGGGAQMSIPDGPQSHASAPASAHDGPSGSVVSRSKDAGKTCKERTNYASFDCSATVLKSNKECKSASSVLVENKDSYMLNKCSADNKFFIVELCDDIQIDTIVLANYEFFSSSFRHFRVSVSDRYPVKMDKWKDLGTFEAMNVRDIQAFLIENPLIWAKYLRIEFLTHYGTEYYCPVSLLRVHGTTMIEDYRHAEDLARGENEEEIALEPDVSAVPPVAEGSGETTDHSAGQPISTVNEPMTNDLKEQTAPTATISSAVEELSPEETNASSNSTGLTFDGSAPPMQVGVHELPNSNMTCRSSTVTSEAHLFTTPCESSAASHVGDAAVDSSVLNGIPANSTSAPASRSNNSESGIPAAVTNTTTAENPAQSQNETQTNLSTSLGSGENSTSLGTVTTMGENANSTSVNTPTINTARATASPSMGSQPPQPSSQESFFKSFAKRLTQLESNSTLSLQYIEEQSRILRDAFSKVEKRQLSTTSNFLSQLNGTVMAELHGFRQAYDQLWQSTVIELEAQREAYQREMLALSARLTLVADELVWQKRLGMVQSTLLLLCLALVLFGRGGGGYMEMPLMQQMMNRSTAALRSGWESPPNSPSPDSRSPVSLFRRKLWRSKTEPVAGAHTLTDSEVSRPQSKEGPAFLVEPPSPALRGPQSDCDDERDEDSSPDMSRKEPSGDAMHVQSTVSPKKNRKKPKKPANWPIGNGGGPNERPKSPLAS